ncbi:hypothetical protein FTX61_22205 [Nitriliruptoraceae bacterium ZYF776]|nr:hypothetical protein [Profundirhabdus halotolerans]
MVEGLNSIFAVDSDSRVVLDEPPRLEYWETAALTAYNTWNLEDTLDSKLKMMISENKTALEADNSFEELE